MVTITTASSRINTEGPNKLDAARVRVVSYHSDFYTFIDGGSGEAKCKLKGGKY